MVLFYSRWNAQIVTAVKGRGKKKRISKNEKNTNTTFLVRCVCVREREIKCIWFLVSPIRQTLHPLLKITGISNICCICALIRKSVGLLRYNGIFPHLLTLSPSKDRMKVPEIVFFPLLPLPPHTITQSSFLHLFYSFPLRPSLHLIAP